MGGILFGRFDFGDQPCELGRAPFGANMAFRKEMFDKYGAFQIDLGPGPNPGTTRLNEDTEFGRRLISAGERLRYEPKAVVYHPVAPDRLNQKFFLRWWFDYGRSRVRELKRRYKVCGINRDYARIPKDLIFRMPLEIGRWMFSLSPQKRFRHKCFVWHTAGRIAETYHRTFHPQSHKNGRTARDGDEMKCSAELEAQPRGD
jgi:GT2 family glycosyltransferase